MSTKGSKIGSLFFGVGMDTGEFKKKIKEIQKDLKKFNNSVKEGFKISGTILAGFTVGVAGLATGLGILTKKTIEEINASNILAKSIGATVEEIEGLRLASDTYNVSQDMLIDKMREVGGIDAFKKIAEEIKNAGSEASQLSLAKTYGNEFIKLLPVLKLGADGLKSFEQEAIKLGLALSPEKVQKAVDAWTEYEKLLFTLKGLTNQLGAGFSQNFADISIFFSSSISTMSDEILNFASMFSTSISEASNKVSVELFSFGQGMFTFLKDSATGLLYLTELIFGLGSETKNTTGLFTLMGDFLSTLPQSLMVGVKNIGALIVAFFGTIGNAILRVVTEPLIFIMDLVLKLLSMIPGISKGIEKARGELAENADIFREQFSFDISDNFDQAKTIEFFNTEKLEDEMSEIIGKRIESEEEFSKKLDEARIGFKKNKTDVNNAGSDDIGGLGLFGDIFKLGGAITGTVEKIMEVAKRAIQPQQEQDRPQIALAGSIEAFSAENKKNNEIIDLNRQQLQQQKILNTNIMRLGVY